VTSIRPAAWTDLYWLPLGAGGRCVRFNGRLYEGLAALAQHRPPRDLYHCALQVSLGGTTYAIEVAPVWNIDAPDRGAVCVGPVGSRRLRRFRSFQYEVRCWPGGYIPDLAEAVNSPQRLSDDVHQAAGVLDVLKKTPPLTWGRDELHLGDMWNSNSVVAWLIASAGLTAEEVPLPPRGRAPGWTAGIAVARRQCRAA